MEQPFSCPIFHHTSLPSTQDEARELVSQGTFPFVVMAGQQTAGRGRSGRKWVSLPDNLQCTLAFESALDLKHIGQYAFLVAVAAQQTMAAYAVEHITLKWPNDVLLNGQKIAGILIEAEQVNPSQRVLLVGMGVNITSAPDGATALNAHMSTPVIPRDFLEKFMSIFLPLKEHMEKGGFTDIRAKWLDRAHGLGGNILVRLPNESFEGIFKGIAEDGALYVQVTGETASRVVYSGDVFIGGRADVAGN